MSPLPGSVRGADSSAKSCRSCHNPVSDSGSSVVVVMSVRPSVRATSASVPAQRSVSSPSDERGSTR